MSLSKLLFSIYCLSSTKFCLEIDVIMFKYSIPCSDIVPRKWIEINFEIKSFNPINAFDDTQNKNIG